MPYLGRRLKSGADVLRVNGKQQARRDLRPTGLRDL